MKIHYKIVELTVYDSGYKSLAIRDLTNDSVTIASAGTDQDDIWGTDGWNDAQMIIANIPDQFESAKNFVNSLKGGEDPTIPDDTVINFTGHSLGGSISQLLTVEYYKEGIIEKKLPSGVSIYKREHCA